MSDDFFQVLAYYTSKVCLIKTFCFMKIGKYLLIKINKCILIQDMNLVQIKTKSLYDVKKNQAKSLIFSF